MESLIMPPTLSAEPDLQIPALELERVTIYLGRQQVLKDASFAVQAGKLSVLLGPNGVGKTTLLRGIDGLIPLAGGEIRVQGRSIASLSRKELSRQLAYVPQFHQGVFSYSVKDFVLLGRAPYLPWFGAPGSGDQELALEVLTQLGISHLAGRNYLHLSGGERQLVLLARGLVQGASVILLDEPTAHLDFSYRHRIMGTIKKLTEEKNLAALVSVHDPNLALEYGDQIVLLHEQTVAANLSSESDDFLSRLELVLKRVYGSEIEVWRLPQQAVVVRG